MSDGTLTYSVPDVSCEHCRTAISTEVSTVSGVASVEVDLARKIVVVRGGDLDDAAVRAAIAEAGYEVAGAPPG
jgi:copper chaperone